MATEHPAVLAPLQALDAEVTLVGVDRQGRVDLQGLSDALSGASGLAVMAANNETGVVSPLDEVAALVREAGVPWHCDAVQLARWAPPMMNAGYGQDITTLALSAHKLGGPQGVGALVVRDGALRPLIVGGAQESGRRGGTPSVAAIGFASTDANFATNLLLATPTEHPSPTSSATRDRTSVAISIGSPSRARAPVTSRNASSRASGST